MATVRLDILMNREPSSGCWRVIAVDAEYGHKYFAGSMLQSTALTNINQLVISQYPADPYLSVVINSARLI